MRTKRDILMNNCEKCGKIQKEGEFYHSEEFGGAVCNKCYLELEAIKEGEKC